MTNASIRGFEALTFDCYGTLIDWRGGVAEATARIPGLSGCDLERLVRDRELVERQLEAGPYLPYGEILAESLRRSALEQGRVVPADDAALFARAMADWRPFPDTGPALRRLGANRRLAILSNVETRILRESVARIGVEFELLITAEELRSYKPARAHFDAAVERLRLPKERILHVAASVFHDIRPASALGWTTAWVNRERESRTADVAPRFETPDLGSLADRLER